MRGPGVPLPPPLPRPTDPPPTHQRDDETAAAIRDYGAAAVVVAPAYGPAGVVLPSRCPRERVWVTTGGAGGVECGGCAG